MSKAKFKDTDYLVISSALRAREGKMLNKSRIDRMLAAPSFDESAKVLTFCGYPDMTGMKAEAIQAILNARRDEAYKELLSKEHTRGVVSLFAKKYDYHNLKVMVKAQSLDIDAGNMLSDGGTATKEQIFTAFGRDEFSLLPKSLRTAAENARAVLASSHDPQQSDISLDKAYFADIASDAKAIGNKFISGYVQALIDSANLRTAVRALRASLSPAAAKASLIPGGSVDIVNVSLTPEKIYECYSSSLFSQAAKLGLESFKGISLTAFEKACDETISAYLTRTALVPFGPEAVLGYLVKLDGEMATIRMILTGKLSGIEPETIRERLRIDYV